LRRARLVATVLALGVCACRDTRNSNDTASHAPGTQRALPLRKVRVAFQPFVSWGPLMIAHDEGFFRDEGLDVEFVPALRSEETTVALVSGDVDVRPGPVSAGLLSAIVQGAPVRLTAGMGYLARDGCPYFGIVLRRGLGVSGTPAIKRMRASQDGFSRFLVTLMLASKQVHLDAIETVRLPQPVMVSALQSGAIDAVAASEPLLTRAADVGTRWMSTQQVAPDYQWGVIAFSERLLTRDRDTGVRFMRAYRRGVAQYLQGKTPRNVDIISRQTGDTPAELRRSCWPSFQADARLNWPSIDGFQHWAVGEKLMERELTATQLWDSAFVSATDSVRAGRAP
jgi:NitT/TauT family transport system substrate-binding protein